MSKAHRTALRNPASRRGPPAPMTHAFPGAAGGGPDDLARGLALFVQDKAGAIRMWRSAVAAGRLAAEDLGVAGLAAYEAGRDGEALALFQAAAAENPSVPAFHANAGLILLSDPMRRAAAVESLNRALALDPNHVGALLNLGAICLDGKRFPEALSFFRRVLSKAPENVTARLGAINASRQICQWGAVEEEEAAIAHLLERTGTPISPFILLSSHVSPADHLHAARLFTRSLRFSPADRLPPPPPADPSRPIRIGYLSSDLYHHATAFLAVELFERHDRSAFTLHAYSHGPDDGSAMRRRVVAAFDHFVEVGHLSAVEAARRIRADGIDILVDLKGYTLGCRTEILALRPAPVQVSFLGYPGTMGADFMDYIIGDRVVTPLALAGDYDEKIVQLPGAYQPNDSRRAIAETVPSRAACGLPEDGFVFCCFNNTYKITPALFRLWMRLLAQVPGSVLWLFEANPAARDNLAYEAASAGIDPDRLIFAPRMDLADHLARHAHADLFLDTLPYNAHTTASDALWCGVPVLTCMGESFAARVAASLLSAVGLPELITTSLADYEALALALARDPARLAALKAHLKANRGSAPLFDAGAFTRGLEAAFTRMHALRQAGKAPEAIIVSGADLPSAQPISNDTP